MKTLTLIRPNPLVGDLMPDGTIYLGVSPQTDRDFYFGSAVPEGFLPWNMAMKYASRVWAHGRTDWRIPTLDELAIIYKMRHLIGGFDLDRYYWASAPHYLQNGWSMSFDHGARGMTSKREECVVCCVRGPDCAYPS